MSIGVYQTLNGVKDVLKACCSGRGPKTLA